MLSTRPRLLPTFCASTWAVLVGLCMVLLVALVPGSAAANNPDVKWKTIETEHFYVHFWSGQEDAAGFRVHR